MQVLFIMSIVLYFLAWIQLTISSYVKIQADKTYESYVKVHNRVMKELDEVHNQKLDIKKRTEELEKLKKEIFEMKMEDNENGDI